MKLDPTLDEAIALHNEFRDHIHGTCHGIHEVRLEPTSALVLMRSFNSCFNTYKAIGLLLPERYYEHAGALLRIMWEATLNLAWVAVGPMERSRAFLQFTVEEALRFRRNRVLEFETADDPVSAEKARRQLVDFETTYASVLSEFRGSNRQSKRLPQRFSSGNLEALAVELGEPWSVEYRGVYPLLCAFAHGSPGVVLFPLPVVEDFAELDPANLAQVDEPRTVDLALWSMAVIERSYSALLHAVKVDDSEYLDELERRVSFRSSMTRRSR